MTFKLVKTAAAIALGASLVATTVLPGVNDASAASKYKIKSGKLVVAKTGKVVKGYVTFNKLVYKDGKKLTGLKSSVYYKSGKKATGIYKSAYYVNGAKKVTTGTYNKAYYVKGVRVVTTGLYKDLYYLEGKKATGTYKSAYYVNGAKKVTTGTYAGAYYVSGKKVATTGLYKEQLYTKGTLSKGLALFDGKLYKDAVLNAGLALFDGKLYNGAVLNTGIVAYKDAKGLEAFYNNEVLAEGTFENVDGKQEAFEKGIKQEAKVKGFKVLDGATIEITFNKSVNKNSAEAADVVKLEGATINSTTLSENGLTLTVKYELNTGVKEFKNNAIDISAIATKADEKVFTNRFVGLVTFKDVAAATIKEITQVNSLDTNGAKPVQMTTATIHLNKKVTSIGQVTVNGEVVSNALNSDKETITFEVEAGKTIDVELFNVIDALGNKAAKLSTTIKTAADVTNPTATITAAGTTATIVTSEAVKDFKVAVNGTDIDAIKVANKENTYTVDLSSVLGASLVDGAFLNDVKLEIAKGALVDVVENTNAEAITKTTTVIYKAETAAAITSSSIAADGKTVTVNYDKELTVAPSVSTFQYNYKVDGVSHPTLQDAIVSDTQLSADKKSVVYTLDQVLPEGNVTVVINDKLSTTATVKHVVIPGVVAANIAYNVTAAKNVITVSYTTAAKENLTDSATNVANYKLGNEALPAGSKAEFVNDKHTVEITLPTSYAIDTNKTVQFTASNIEDVKGNTLVENQLKSVQLTDNVAPTASATAILNGDKQATVTFSEDLQSQAAIAGVTVFVNGKEVSGTFTVEKKVLTVNLNEAIKNTDVVTIAIDGKTINLVDAEGNKATIK